MSERPYLTRDISEKIERILSAAVAAVTAGTEDDPKAAYERLLDAHMEINEANSALWCSIYVECPECGGQSAIDQSDDCPLCGPHMGYIPRHQFARVDPIWQDPAPVVVCPVCDGECDVVIDGYAKPCPACDGIGRMSKEDAVLAVYQLDADETEDETEHERFCHSKPANQENK